jgi:hypothetical protein
LPTGVQSKIGKRFLDSGALNTAAMAWFKRSTSMIFKLAV